MDPLLLHRQRDTLTRHPKTLKFYTKLAFVLFCEEGHGLHQILDKPMSLDSLGIDYVLMNQMKIKGFCQPKYISGPSWKIFPCFIYPVRLSKWGAGGGFWQLHRSFDG